MGYSMQEHVRQNQRVKVAPGFGYGNERERERRVEDSVGFGGPKNQTPPLPKTKCNCVPDILCALYLLDGLLGVGILVGWLGTWDRHGGNIHSFLLGCGSH